MEPALLESGTPRNRCTAPVSEPQFIDVAGVDEIPEKSFKCVDAGGVAVAVCRFRDEYFAVENRCSHALATFDDGRMRGYRLMCPLHGATFDIRDGSVAGAPATRPIRAFPVRVEGGRVAVDVSGAGSGEDEASAPPFA